MVSVAFFLMGTTFFCVIVFVSVASSMPVIGFMSIFFMVTVTACVSVLVSIAVAVMVAMAVVMTMAVAGCKELVSGIIVGHVHKCSILNVTSEDTFF